MEKWKHHASAQVLHLPIDYLEIQGKKNASN